MLLCTPRRLSQKLCVHERGATKMKIRGEGLWKEGRCGAGAAVVCKRQITIKEPSDEQKSRSCVSFVDMVYGNPLGLPRLPIPTLQDTVKRYLQSLEPLTRKRPEELARAMATAQEFLKGDGPVLQSIVTEKDAIRKAYPYSYIERLWDDMYLCGRWSLPINSNPFLALQPPPKGASAGLASGGAHDAQIVGATRFISSFLKWSRRVRDGTFEPDTPPGCPYGYPLQAGTGRIARKNRDELQFHSASRHAVVFCNNRVYRLNLLGTGEEEQRQLSESDLAKALEIIRASAFSEPYGPSPGDAFVGHLTTKGRDKWGAARAALEGFSPVNRATLFEIDSALLTIAMDDCHALDLKAQARAYLTGNNGRNRWFDKHQLVVLKDGSMAVNFEHSYSDGVIWTRMLGEIWHDMYDVQAKGIRTLPKAPLLVNPTPPPRELLWKLPEELKGEVQYAHKEFVGTCGGYSLDVVDFQDFGKNSCKKWKVSPDATAQMAIQLAYQRLHGDMAPTYESCATRSFHRGRTEAIRSCTTESADFVEAMSSDSNRKDTRRAAFDRAVAAHVALAKAAQQGQGVDQHVLALRAAATQAAEEGGGIKSGTLGAVFFEDPLLAQSSHWKLSTSNLSYPFLVLFGFGPVVNDGYGIGYIVDNDTIRMAVTALNGTGETDGSMMMKGVEQSLGDIAHILG